MAWGGRWSSRGGGRGWDDWDDYDRWGGSGSSTGGKDNSTDWSKYTYLNGQAKAAHTVPTEQRAWLIREIAGPEIKLPILRTLRWCADVVDGILYILCGVPRRTAIRQWGQDATRESIAEACTEEFHAKYSAAEIRIIFTRILDNAGNDEHLLEWAVEEGFNLDVMEKAPKEARGAAAAQGQAPPIRALARQSTQEMEENLLKRKRRAELEKQASLAETEAAQVRHQLATIQQEGPAGGSPAASSPVVAAGAPAGHTALVASFLTGSPLGAGAVPGVLAAVPGAGAPGAGAAAPGPGAGALVPWVPAASAQAEAEAAALLRQQLQETAEMENEVLRMQADLAQSQAEEYHLGQEVQSAQNVLTQARADMDKQQQTIANMEEEVRQEQAAHQAVESALAAARGAHATFEEHLRTQFQREMAAKDSEYRSELRCTHAVAEAAASSAESGIRQLRQQMDAAGNALHGGTQRQAGAGRHA